MEKLPGLLVVLIGVVIAAAFANNGKDVGTLIGIAVVALGINLVWHSGPKRDATDRR